MQASLWTLVFAAALLLSLAVWLAPKPQPKAAAGAPVPTMAEVKAVIDQRSASSPTRRSNTLKVSRCETE
jgi:hypothetical protein